MMCLTAGRASLECQMCSTSGHAATSQLEWYRFGIVFINRKSRVLTRFGWALSNKVLARRNFSIGMVSFWYRFYKSKTEGLTRFGWGPAWPPQTHIFLYYFVQT